MTTFIDKKNGGHYAQIALFSERDFPDDDWSDDYFNVGSFAKDLDEERHAYLVEDVAQLIKDTWEDYMECAEADEEDHRMVCYNAEGICWTYDDWDASFFADNAK